MLVGANTHLSKICLTLSVEIYYYLQVKPAKVNLKLNWWIFIFCILATNGLMGRSEVMSDSFDVLIESWRMCSND